jgi:hypothetical protein
MSLLFKYVPVRMRTPAIALGGRATRPKPLIPVTVVGPANTRLLQALLDTAADDTVFPDSLASLLGVDLTGALESEASGVGGLPAVRLRFAQVSLRLATSTERREWPAVVGFTAAPLRFPLLGFAGALQFFDADFRGAHEEVELTVNSLYPGT